MNVKICGLTSLEDAMAAVNLGADALGFNFYPKSKRYIQPTLAADIIRALPNAVEKVGVFVNTSLSEIKAVQAATAINSVQVHGDETLAFCSQIPFSLIKAVRLHPQFDLTELDLFDEAITILIDAFDENIYGGTGQLANWEMAQQLAKKRNVILAGGLNAENVVQAIAKVNPLMVDVCSGVEQSPGVKSLVKMRDFFAQVNEVSL